MEGAQICRVIWREIKNKNEFEIKNKNVKILYIKHCEKLPIWALDNKKENLKKTFQIGYNEVLNNKELKKFLDLERK